MTAVVTFDAGQTLVELDLDFLATRLGERGVAISAQTLDKATAAAWRRYDELVDAGQGHPWKALMATLLAGLPERDALVEWLWREQPARNLWRKPIPDMIELARELAAAGVSVGVLSNSEGRLAELFDEVGIREPFAHVIDSGRVGIEKPDPRIFTHALSQLGDGTPRVHIGDSWAADVRGALGAGWDAIWYWSRDAKGKSDPRVPTATTAHEVRAALVSFGVLPR